MAVIDDNTGETLALDMHEKFLEIETTLAALYCTMVTAGLISPEAWQKLRARCKATIEQAMAEQAEKLSAIRPDLKVQAGITNE